MLLRYGMVHGRFQPFHLGHLEYALAALRRCEHLFIGITNADPSLILPEAADPERHTPEANLFTFFERQWMIRAALLATSVDPTRTSIVPFPIHHPDRWQFYCPPETTQFVRIFSAWGKEKLRRFEETGWRVEVLGSGAAKEVSGSEVRRRMLSGQGWEELVSPAVAAVLRGMGAVERVRQVGSRQ